MIKENYDYWLDPEHPRILYHHPNLTEQELLGKVESAWWSFYSFPAVLQRSKHFGLFSDWRRLLAYSVVCRGLLTRYKRYGLCAVKGTRRKLATLGRAALKLMKRPRIAHATAAADSI